jgi:hypothetical protein
MTTIKAMMEWLRCQVEWSIVFDHSLDQGMGKFIIYSKRSRAVVGGEFATQLLALTWLYLRAGFLDTTSGDA